MPQAVLLRLSFRDADNKVSRGMWAVAWVILWLVACRTGRKRSMFIACELATTTPNPAPSLPVCHTGTAMEAAPTRCSSIEME